MDCRIKDFKESFLCLVARALSHQVPMQLTFVIFVIVWLSVDQLVPWARTFIVQNNAVTVVNGSF